MDSQFKTAAIVLYCGVIGLFVRYGEPYVVQRGIAAYRDPCVHDGSREGKFYERGSGSFRYVYFHVCRTGANDRSRIAGRTAGR